MNGNSVPEPQVIKPAQNPYRKYLLVVFGIGVIFTVVILLRFHILDNLISKKVIPSSSPSPKLTLSCPVAKEYCQQGKEIKNGDQIIGLGFNLPVQSKIYAAIEGKTIPAIAQENKELNIPNHSKITIEGEGNNQGYTIIYEYFGLPGKNIQSKVIPQSVEIATIWGGKYPEKSIYGGMNVIFTIKLNNKVIPILPTDFTNN